jgi:hypothetical protein
MKRSAILIALVFGSAFARGQGATPPPVQLTQSSPRNIGKLKLPAGFRLGPVIPGLNEGGVPQGLAYLKDQDSILISLYFEDGQASMISIISDKTGKLTKSLALVDENDSPHKGHVGGIAVSKKYLWVGSDRLYRVPLSDVSKAKAIDVLRLKPAFATESKTAYLACSEQVLWVGEFVLDKDPKANPAHHLKDRDGQPRDAWVSGYVLDEQDDAKAKGLAANDPLPPDFVLAVRSKVQGIAFLRNQVCLSISYGRNNPSKGRPHQMVKMQNGTIVPVWFLDGKNRIKEIAYPPMSEGIVPCKNGFAVICESGAKKYRKGAKHEPLDYVVRIPAP